MSCSIKLEIREREKMKERRSKKKRDKALSPGAGIERVRMETLMPGGAHPREEERLGYR